MHVAVIIPSRDPAHSPLLAWTLEGYAGQKLGGHTLEIRVGIDGAAAGDAPAAASPSPAPQPPAATPHPVRITTFARSGAAAVRNRLMDQAPADLFIFGNSDARPEPDMVQQHADTISALPAGSMVLGSAPWETAPTPTVLDALLAETPMIFFYHQMTAGQWYDFRHAWTLNLSVRSADLRGANFDEQLRPVYFEDLAFAHRLMGATAKKIYYLPAARVTHRHPTTMDQYLDREELLGIMSPVLHKNAPEAFAALHDGRHLLELAPLFRHWVRMDQTMHHYIYKRLAAWCAQPAAGLPARGAARDQLLMTIYQMHLPLKRLAFRLGFLRGMEWVEDAHWLQRKPSGLWKKLSAI